MALSSVRQKCVCCGYWAVLAETPNICGGGLEICLLPISMEGLSISSVVLFCLVETRDRISHQYVWVQF